MVILHRLDLLLSMIGSDISGILNAVIVARSTTRHLLDDYNHDSISSA